MKALQGITILNTRPAHQAASLTSAIEKRGGISVEIPLIAIHSPKNTNRRNAELAALDKAGWVIFTSINSFEFLARALKENGRDSFEALQSKKLAAVGEKTKQALEQAGLTVEFVPEVYDAGRLAEGLINVTHKGDTFFYPRSSRSRHVMMHALRQSGRQVHDMIAYETAADPSRKNELNRLLKEKRIDVVILTSPSAVQSFFSQMEKGVHDVVKHSVFFAVIGGVTAEALVRYDINRILAPETFTLDAVLNNIESHFHKED